MSSHISYQDDNLNNQTEIKESNELLDENGILKCRGWARQPCLKYNPNKLSKFRKAYRLKEWNYYSIGSKYFYFAVAAIDLGYINNYQTFFIDFTEDLVAANSDSPSDTTSSKNKNQMNYLMDDILSTSAFTKGLCLPSDSCQTGNHAKYESKNFKLEFTVDDQSKHHIKIYSKKIGLSGDLVFDLSPNRESIVLVTPIGKENFYYNRKTNLIPVTGSLTVDGKEMLTPESDCHGIMDWGRGCWDYNSFWLWSSAWGRCEIHGQSTPIGLNFGSGFGNLSTHTENAVNVDGIIHKLGHVDISYNDDNLLEPWKFTCKHGRFGDQPLIFTPFKKKLDNNNFGIIMSYFHQILGRFTGEIILDNGERININIIGFTEVHKARW